MPNPLSVLAQMSPEDALKYLGANQNQSMPPELTGLSPEGGVYEQMALAMQREQEQKAKAQQEALAAAQAPVGAPPPQAAPVDQESGFQQALDQYTQAARSAMRKGENAIDQQRHVNADILNKPFEADMSPLLAFIDSLGSAKVSQTYKRPETLEERQALASKLQEALTKQQMGLSSQEVELMKERLAAIASHDKASNLGPIEALKLQFMMRGKELPETAVDKISQFESGVSDANGLLTKIENNPHLLGLMRGTITTFNPKDVAGRQLLADIDRVKQSIGKSLEGGVLRKEDEEKYKKILATITDEPKVAVYKLKELIQAINEKRAQYLGNLQKAGYYTSGLTQGAPATNDAEIQRLIELRKLKGQ